MPTAAIGELEVVTVGELAHEAMRARKLRRPQHPGIVDPGPLARDVLAHRARQKHAVLHRDADLRAHRTGIILEDVGAVDHHQHFLEIGRAHVGTPDTKTTLAYGISL